MPEPKYQVGAQVALKQKRNIGTFLAPSPISLLPNAVGKIESFYATLSPGNYYYVDFTCGDFMVVCIPLHEDELRALVLDEEPKIAL
jgi:hypothetical protein